VSQLASHCPTGTPITEMQSEPRAGQGLRAHPRGLDGLDLEVATGAVFGFLEPDGADKTTTIRRLLDLIRPTAGSVTVLGLDPRVDGVD
jgi:ABC-type multidrug transport system ATPase subunit